MASIGGLTHPVISQTASFYIHTHTHTSALVIYKTGCGSSDQ